jgi:hypothetical protein
MSLNPFLIAVLTSGSTHHLTIASSMNGHRVLEGDWQRSCTVYTIKPSKLFLKQKCTLPEPGTAPPKFEEEQTNASYTDGQQSHDRTK